MGRTCVTLLAVVIAIPVTLVVHDVAYSLARSIWTGFGSANVTNYGFYLHVVKHTRSWNFLEGIGRRTQYA
jgi:multidrug transporter EmrE-like cation transporter